MERFTFRSPGQAASYFDGYTRLREIRTAAEKALGPKFNVQRFHDFILSQGLLPPNLLRKAVMEDFVARAAAVRLSSRPIAGLGIQIEGAGQRDFDDRILCPQSGDRGAFRLPLRVTQSRFFFRIDHPYPLDAD